MIKKILIRFFAYAVIFYLALSCSVYFMQWRILYPATGEVSSVEDAKKLVSGVQEYLIDIAQEPKDKDDKKVSEDKIRIFYAPSKNGKTIVLYYGNRKTMADSIKDAKAYYDLGYGLLACSYPGYDGNPGPANAKRLYSAVSSCLDFLNNEKKIKDNDIIVHGHSLGGHMAVYAAQNRGFYAVILLAPLGSALDIARSKYPYLPVALILQDHLVSYDMAKNITAPVFLAHNIKDSVVPYRQGLKIYNNVRSKKKFLKTIDYLLPGDNGHGNIYSYEIRPDIVRFLK